METGLSRRVMRYRGAYAVAALPLLLLAAVPASAEEPGYEVAPARINCRYPAASSMGDLPQGEDPGRLASVLLPEDNVFRPLLADPKQPRFFTNYRRVHFRGAAAPAEGEGRTINAGIIALGGSFGLWGLRQPRGCDGVQASFFGAIFSQFNLDAASADLLNTDFLVGPEFTARRGLLSARVRLYHQSSHLGDEFLLNFAIANGVMRDDLSFEAVDALVSLEGQWWRLYGGGGAILTGNEPRIDPGLLQWGLELRGPSWRPWRGLGRTRFQPIFGADFQSLEEREWTITTSLKGGLEWSTPGGAHRVRLLIDYLRGFIPFGQFFITEKIENFGVEVQFEF